MDMSCSGLERATSDEAQYQDGKGKQPSFVPFIIKDTVSTMFTRLDIAKTFPESQKIWTLWWRLCTIHQPGEQNGSSAPSAIQRAG